MLVIDLGRQKIDIQNINDRKLYCIIHMNCRTCSDKWK